VIADLDTLLTALYVELTVGHPLPGVIVPHRHAEWPVVWVLADARHGPGQEIQCLSGQPAHLPQRPVLQPRPVAHELGRYCRSASSSGMPLPVPPRARSLAS
jgi:hypothetical protein